MSPNKKLIKPKRFRPKRELTKEERKLRHIHAYARRRFIQPAR